MWPDAHPIPPWAPRLRATFDANTPLIKDTDPELERLLDEEDKYQWVFNERDAALAESAKWKRIAKAQWQSMTHLEEMIVELRRDRDNWKFAAEHLFASLKENGGTNVQ